MLTPDNKRVDGLQYHVAGVTPDGVCIIEVWDSREAMQSFFQSNVAAAMADANVEMQPTFFEVINILE